MNRDLASNNAAFNAAFHHQRRMRSERRFALYGRIALGFSLACLVLLLGSIAVSGLPGFVRSEIRMDFEADIALLELDKGEELADIAPQRFNVFLRAAIDKRFTEFSAGERREILKLFGSASGLEIRQAMVEYDLNSAGENSQENSQENSLIKFSLWLPASAIAAEFLDNPDSETISAAQSRAMANFVAGSVSGSASSSAFGSDVKSGIDYGFLTRGDSRSPENAGFFGAIAGSFFTMLICLLAAFPLAVMAAVYLEEFAKSNLLTEFIEVNINNLAAVPSIVYGLLGLAVYINFMHLPRSAPLVGGLTLALMALPVIIIATRAALKSIPSSIRQAALALGASPLQVVWHHTLPLSMPGIMTGTILGMARALGETAPLLMVGMVAFVVDIPSGFTSAATVMPVQIYLWAGSPEAGFAARTSAAIMVLLLLLLAMNMLAIMLRKKYEIKW